MSMGSRNTSWQLIMASFSTNTAHKAHTEGSRAVQPRCQAPRSCRAASKVCCLPS